MARNLELVTCPPGVWTELTNADATTISFQIQRGSAKIRPTAGAAPASTSLPGYIYHARPVEEQGEDMERGITIASLGAAAGLVRLYAMPINGRTAEFLVDHA